jgi:hypothetical protein
MCLLSLLLQVKARVMAATSWPDNALTHLATALITGVVSTTATNPVDVVKTYMFVGEERMSLVGPVHLNVLLPLTLNELYTLQPGFRQGEDRGCISKLHL